MSKLNVYVTHGFPFYDAVNRVYITSTPVEVENSPWLQAQIDAGLVKIKPEAKPSEKDAETVKTAEASETAVKPKARSRK